jgi:predicted dehydrogenase
MRLRFYGDPAKRSWRVPFEEETIGIERADPLTRQLANFCAVIRGTAEPVVSARDGLQNVRVLDAIRQAAASGQTCVIGK